MKTYMDFIADVTSNSSLLQELERILPFPDLTTLNTWFQNKGYHLAGADAEMLYASQASLMENSEQINY